MSTTAKPQKTDYFERSFESETKPFNWLVIRNNFKGIHPQTNNNPHPKIKDPGPGNCSTPVDRVNASFGIDFRHAVEFSRIGRTPQSDLSARLPGQPALLYRSRSTESSPSFSDPPPASKLSPRVRRRGSAQLALGGSERPAALASCASLQQGEHYVARRWRSNRPPVC